MATINFSGLATGIDFEKLISATSDASRAARVLPNQRKVQNLTDTNTSLNELKSKLSVLKDKIQDFTTVSGGALSKSGTSSDETIVTASATAAAPNGTYSLTVTQLAKSHTMSFNDRFAATDSVVASGIVDPATDAPAHSREIEITVGSEDPFYIDITPTTKLSDVASAINNASTKVVATVVNTGQSPNPYALILKSTVTGATDGTISVVTGQDIIDVSLFQNKTEDPAQNASFSLTGISGAISSSTNSIAGVIPGVTFNLVATTTSPVTITVADDVSGTTAKVSELVNAFNDIVAYIKENDKVERKESGTSVTNIFGPLAGTQIDENVIQAIRAQIVAAKNESGTEVRIFADLGIASQQDGTLKFKSSDLSDALANDSESVATILQTFADAVALTNGTLDNFIGFNQIFDTAVNANKESITSINQKIAETEASILKNEGDMRQRFARLESLTSKLQSQQAQLASALSGLGGG